MTLFEVFKDSQTAVAELKMGTKAIRVFFHNAAPHYFDTVPTLFVIWKMDTDEHWSICSLQHKHLISTEWYPVT